MPNSKAYGLNFSKHTSILAFILTLLIERVLSSVGSLGANIICSKIPGLSPRQRGICQNHPRAMVAVGEGAKVGLEECQNQFSGMRWNCSSSLAQLSLFGHHHVTGTKESSYSNAITSAAVAYAVTQSCSKGNLGDACGCDRSKKPGRLSPKGWKWGGCSADWKYGVKYSKRFLDAGENTDTARALMNKHNNQAGRKAFKNKVVDSLNCKCHGVSGACTVKTCWTTLPKFHTIGQHLIKKYQKAKRVVPVNGKRTRRPVNLRLKRSKTNKKPRNGDLVYLASSPNYCKSDPKLGSLGTRGRQCKKNTTGKNSCDLLCCNRGFHSDSFTRTSKCHCKFHWCCSVTCDTCTEQVEVNTCK